MVCQALPLQWNIHRRREWASAKVVDRSESLELRNLWRGYWWHDGVGDDSWHFRVVFQLLRSYRCEWELVVDGALAILAESFLMMTRWHKNEWSWLWNVQKSVKSVNKRHWLNIHFSFWILFWTNWSSSNIVAHTAEQMAARSPSKPSSGVRSDCAASAVEGLFSKIASGKFSVKNFEHCPRTYGIIRGETEVGDHDVTCSWLMIFFTSPSSTPWRTTRQCWIPMVFSPRINLFSPSSGSLRQSYVSTTEPKMVFSCGMRA